MPIFDTHAHYDADRFDSDRDALLSAMPGGGVGLVLDPGCDLPSSRAAAELAERYPHVYAAVGVHPEDCDGFQDEDLTELRQLLERPKVVAIGEIGLDYYWEDNPPRAFQQTVFRKQLALAAELDLPVIIHSREAVEDTLRLLKQYQPKGVVHCFSGSVEMAKEVLNLGMYIGFTGVLTFKNARKAVEVVQYAPADRLLIETDCPYMAPEPLRGRRCDSTMLQYTLARMAELKGLTPEEMAAITWKNACTVYGLPE